MTLSEAAHVVANFMEPVPAELSWRPDHDLKWWKYVCVPKDRLFRPFPNDDKTGSLDALREVEERLTEVQRYAYLNCLQWDEASTQGKRKVLDLFGIVNASDKTKLLALGEVLRSDTEVRV